MQIQSFVLLCVVVCGLSAAPADQDIAADAGKRKALVNLLTMDADHLHFCHRDVDCAADLQMPICDGMIRLCKAREAPAMEWIYGKCVNDDDCRPMYRCHTAQCHFSGPKACESDLDCLRGVGALSYQCKNLTASAPGTRCWLRCQKDRDCHECDGDECRIPEDVRPHIGCCQGYCQRKVACSGTSISDSDFFSSRQRSRDI